MAGKGGQMDRDERWDPLDENTVESIADIICDDGGTNYREGWKLPQFLRRAGPRQHVNRRLLRQRHLRREVR